MSRVQELIRNRRRRGASRGAIFVEAMCTVIVFLVLNAALIWLQSVYQTKLYTMRKVREEVWKTASEGCQGAPSAGDDTVPSGAPPDSSLMQLQGVLAQPQQLAQTQVVKETLTKLPRQETAATTTKQSVNESEFMGKSFRTANTCMCNEVPKDIQESEIHQSAQAFYRRFIGN